MAIDIVNKLDPVFETAGLLYVSHHLDKNKQETINELTNLGLNGEMFYQKNMKIFEKYVQVFKKNSVSNPTTDSFFFEEENSDFFLLVLTALAENRQWLSSIDEAADEQISEVFIRYLKEGCSYDFYPGTDKFEDIFVFLEKSELPESMKWKILCVLHHPKKWMAELVQAVNSNCGAYKKAVESVKQPLNKMLSKYEGHNDEQFSKMVSSLATISTIYPTLVFPISQLLFFTHGYYGLLSDKVLKNEKKSSGFSDTLIIGLKALSDSSKLEILKSLKIAPKYNLEIAENLGLTPATMSYHMNVLLTCGFVGIEKRDGKVYYHLEQENLKKLIGDLEQLLL